MANTKSAIKAARKSKRLHDRNQSVKTQLKSLHKKLEAAIKGKDAGAARQDAKQLRDAGINSPGQTNGAGISPSPTPERCPAGH